MSDSSKNGYEATTHKKILVVDNNSERSLQLNTVLTFIGEHFVHCSQEQATQQLAEHKLLTVILTGNVSDECTRLIKANPSTPFILHDVLDATLLNSYVNVIGLLATPLNYAQLTELIHHCHQYYNKLPRTGNKAHSAVLIRSLVGSSKPMADVRFF